MPGQYWVCLFRANTPNVSALCLWLGLKKKMWKVKKKEQFRFTLPKRGLRAQAHPSAAAFVFSPGDFS